MKCLSIQQPWAWLIVNGFKDCENRSWYTSYRGPILIHAGKKLAASMFGLVGHIWLLNRGIELPAQESLPVGAIVGKAFICSVTRERSSDWHEEGQFGFYLCNAISFMEPIPMRGQLGIFDATENVRKMCVGRQ